MYRKIFGTRFFILLGRLAGDTTTDVRLLSEHHLVLATPQQWDMLSRRWKQRKAVQAVGLFVMDEMQLLGGQQGPTMEVRVLKAVCCPSSAYV